MKGPFKLLIDAVPQALPAVCGGISMILEVQNLSFAYRKQKKGQRQVLQNLQLTLKSGDRMGITAPSGRGKTTLCKLLAGYERPDTGSILLDGKPLESFRGICPVQMIWQHPELAVNPLLPLEKTLEEAGTVEERVLRGLHIQREWLKRYPAEISGGELQRFCIARALQPSVKFLLCDEITAMLDLVTQAQIWNFLLKEARERNLGLLIVSHNTALLEQLCTGMLSLPGKP